MKKKISEILRYGWSRTLDLIYPPLCHPCGKGLRDGRTLCETCDLSLPRLKEPFCDTCGEEFEGSMEGSFECPNCRSQDFAFSFARPALSNDPRLLEMIHQLKYGRRIDLAAELGRLAGDSFADPRLAEALAGRWPLVPVPLHRRREQWRHFNQAWEIARALGKTTGLPVLKALSRQRPTNAQTRLTRAQRLKNLQGAFALSKNGRRDLDRLLAGVVLIDDVFTTGATTHECARVLRRAGVQKVVVVTVMRG
ncbi:MAG: amidophosphoribosyltransferase [Akkermansiaceae bacterium]|nr:amidophosphoribosyltransferase [Akkermansiaceae bacterium]